MCIGVLCDKDHDFVVSCSPTVAWGGWVDFPDPDVPGPRVVLHCYFNIY